jgi:hypothetical protein
MADIFLSYARDDLTTAQHMAEVLEARGWSVWWDRKIAPGLSYEMVIEQELTSAKCVLVLWSSASIASSWVRNEAAEAQDRAKLIPILIERVKVPIAFRHMQTCDLTAWNGTSPDAEWDAVVERIGQLQGGQPVSPTPVNQTLLASRFKPRFALRFRPRLKPISKRTKGVAGVGIGLLVLGAILSQVDWPDDYEPDPLLFTDTTSSETGSTDTTSTSDTGNSGTVSASSLDRTASVGTYGEKTLAPGFMPDPEVVSLRAGGSIDVSGLSLGSGCVGWATASPDFVLNLTGTGTRLRFSAASSADTALAVLDPSGSWRCNDDGAGNSNPSITIEPSASGTYRIWVASYRQITAPATLQISERSTSQP